MKQRDCVIIANGGAGGISFPARRRQGLIRAVSIGYGILTQGGSSIDAVVQAVTILEDVSVFNAGTGSSFNLEGEVEMDAAIMTGDRKFGAVGAITNVKNPIQTARFVMERTDHLLLCGDNAVRFARCMHQPFYDPRTREKKRIWRKARQDMKSDHFKRLCGLNELYGTVGVVAVDRKGLICVGTSTGGITLRLPGRVGDTPLPGAGTYADTHGGVSATGHGEEIMRNMIAFRAVSMMARYRAPVVGKKIMEHATDNRCQCGLVGIDRRGDVVCVYNTQGMSWCYIKKGRLRVFGTTND
ncbi:MAG: isoaspartyl peptidase/L-asparaginase [candidate division WOR-3 bacterium]|nr:MAG: isoaspartyl peptidase/L-asparaginase [candidate division WOR-3 bacterium]